MFRKIGELANITLESLNSSTPAVNQEVLDSFTKMAGDLKKIAPKADDFIYFSAVMLHAAEASAYNDDGSPSDRVLSLRVWGHDQLTRPKVKSKEEVKTDVYKLVKAALEKNKEKKEKE